MKKLNRGFVIPLFAGIIAILAIGGIYYYTTQKPLFRNVFKSVCSNCQLSDMGNGSLKLTDQDYGFELQFPKNQYTSMRVAIPQQSQVTIGHVTGENVVTTESVINLGDASGKTSSDLPPKLYIVIQKQNYSDGRYSVPSNPSDQPITISGGQGTIGSEQWLPGLQMVYLVSQENKGYKLWLWVAGLDASNEASYTQMLKTIAGTIKFY